MVNKKGLLHVLWQRVFVDTSKDVCTYYKLRVQEDNCSNTTLETILMETMWNYLNSIKEETQPQTNYCNIRECRYHILVNRTPKCHTEISGEGFE